MKVLAAWERWWFAPAPPVRLATFRILVMVLTLYNACIYEFPLHGGPARGWRPIYYMEVLGLGPIGATAASVELTIWYAAIALGLLGLCTRVACAVAGLLFFHAIGISYSYSKPHHDMIALAFALLALPFSPCGDRLSLDAFIRRRRGAGATRAGDDRGSWSTGVPMRLVAVTIALGYASAGWSKLLAGGLEWLNGYTLQGMMMGVNNAWSAAFSERLWLCQVQSAGLVCLQIGFPLVLCAPRLSWGFVPLMIAFHVVTWKTMDTGHYVNLWYMMLAAFVPWEDVPRTIHRWLGSRRVMPVAAAVLGGFVLPLFVADCLFMHLPGWLAVGLIVPAWALARPFLRRPAAAVPVRTGS